jgi:hypothetical protein
MKKRWILEAITWKVSSTLIGILCVLFITGQYSVTGWYIATYVPLTIAWYLAHKQLWSAWKHRNDEEEDPREPEYHI